MLLHHISTPFLNFSESSPPAIKIYFPLPLKKEGGEGGGGGERPNYA